jgi:DNA-binding transcriptional ArsR family regulator
MAFASDVNDPRLIKALAHPLRVRVLSILEQRDMASPNELAEELDVPLGVMAYHVRRLEALGFIKLAKRTPRRGAVEHHYRAKARPHVTDKGWEQTPSIVKRAMIGATLQQISGVVNVAANEGGFDRGEAHLSRSTLTLDEQGWSELAKDLSALLDRIDEVQRGSLARLEAAGVSKDELTTSGFVMMLFEGGAVPDDAAGRNDANRRHSRGHRSSRKRSRVAAAGRS